MQNGSRQLRRGLALGLLLCGWFGCSNDDESSGPSSGSIETCIRVCEKQADANCSAGPDRDACASVCSALAADPECGSAYLAFTPCGATEASFSCTSSGSLEMRGCWDELRPYSVCAACMVSDQGDDCERCERTSCCAERKAYWGDVNQAAFFECLAGCVARDAGAACDCETRYPTVPAALDAMFSCQTSCAAVCS